MRKNTTDYNVIKAMAIGITAMLAVAKPMTVMAAEGDVVPEGNGDDGVGDVEQKDSEYVAVDEAAEEAKDTVDAAQESADVVKTDVQENVVVGEAGTNEQGEDLAQKVIDAANDVENATSEDGASLTEAETAIENAKIQVDNAEAQDNLSDAALEKADDASQDASDTAEALKDSMDQAETKVDAQIENIEGAATVEDANAAYDEMKSVAEEAQAEYDSKVEEYNEAKAEYEKAIAEVEACEEAYNEAVADASANAQEAADNLKEAQEKAAELETAVEEAKAAVDAATSGASGIADNEKLTQDDNGLVYANQDKLFESIMLNYYIPEVKNINDSNVKLTWSRFSDDDLNYCVVEYSDGTKEYYNYKMDDNSKDKIVIFEKREVEIEGNVSSNPDQYVDEDGTVLTLEEVQNEVSKGTIVEVDGKYYKTMDYTDQLVLVELKTVGKDSNESVSIDENSGKSRYTIDEDGNLVSVWTADVTTTTYEKETDWEYGNYKTPEERDAALAKRLSFVGDDRAVAEIVTSDRTVKIEGYGIPAVKGTITETTIAEGTDKAEAIQTGTSNIIEAVKKQYEQNGYFVFEVSAKNVNATENGDNGYDVTADVEVTYGLVETVALNYSNNFSNEEYELERAQKLAEQNGGIYISSYADPANKKVYYTYVKGVSYNAYDYTHDRAVAEADESFFKDSASQIITLKNQANQEVETVIWNKKITKDETTTGVYGYVFRVLSKPTTITENKEVSRVIFGNAQTLTAQAIQNKNYLDKNYTLTQNDETYRNFVDSAVNLADKYERLLEEAKAANADVAAAQAKVDSLKAAIDALGQSESKADKLAALNERLVAAETDMKEAEETLEEINAKVAAAKDTLDDVINNLTPDDGDGDDDGDGSGSGSGNDDGDGSGSGDSTNDVVIIPTVVSPTGDDGNGAGGEGTGNTLINLNAGADNNADNGAGGDNDNTVTIEDEDTPLSDGQDGSGRGGDDDDHGQGDDEDGIGAEEETLVAIEDEEVPLSGIDPATGKRIPWPWWILILILGATGYKMYKNHQEKKKAAQEAAGK